MDQNKGRYKFLLTGSSARKLRRGAANLLPGRVFTYRLGPFSCAELDYKMDSEKGLFFGTLPEPYLAEQSAFSAKLLASYAGTYLQEEILAETMLRDIQGFSRFFEGVVENSGKFLDFSKLAQTAKISRSAARRYYEILEDTLICDRVEAYKCEAGDLVKHSKYYLFDNGVMNGYSGEFSASGDRKGQLFEHLFFNQLKNTSYVLDQPLEISHFRTRGGLEVDFIIKIQNRLLAIELKSGEPRNSDLKGLQSIQEYLSRPVEKYIACLKCVPKRTGKIEILPWQSVIKKIFSV